ncbi:hypothetical protein [Scrofimicrobium sp. R131]|uniref:Polysaccharide biosynthesis protein n=1 Tax=Scrofimicrobium appendicitidis TaxID=3079930 RepID=A0AAU7V920_9ACTO
MGDKLPQPSKTRLPVVVIGEAAVVGVVQFIPMIALDVPQYALYAAIYLWYGALLAYLFASLSDVWARIFRTSRSEYSRASTYYSVLTSSVIFSILITTAGMLVLQQGWLLSALSGLAVGLALYRAGSRYYLVAVGPALRSGMADLCAAVLSVPLILVWIKSGHYGTEAAIATWLFLTLIYMLVTWSLPRFSLKLTGSWFRHNRRTITAMATEATLMNISSVGTPYLVGAAVGAVGMAALRSATSVAYPVRLILSPLRSRIVVGASGTLMRLCGQASILGLVLGSGAAVVLALFNGLGFLPHSALALLSNYAIPVGVYVAGTALSTTLQFWARGHDAGRILLVKRLVHTAVILGGTLIGAVFFGVEGAMWGTAVSTLLTSVLWLMGTRNNRPAAAAAQREEGQ